MNKDEWKKIREFIHDKEKMNSLDEISKLHLKYLVNMNYGKFKNKINEINRIDEFQKDMKLIIDNRELIKNIYNSGKNDMKYIDTDSFLSFREKMLKEAINKKRKSR